MEGRHWSSEQCESSQDRMAVRETEREGRSTLPWEGDDALLTLPSLAGQRAAVSADVRQGTESGHSHLPGLQPRGEGWQVHSQGGRNRVQGTVRAQRRNCKSRLLKKI